MVHVRLIHQAIEYAKAAEWEKLFELLDEHRDELIVNTVPEPDKYNVLHHAVLHADAGVCKKLIEDYSADPSMLTSDGKCTSELSHAEDDRLACMLRTFEKYMPVHIVQMNGEPLLRNARLSATDKISRLRELANARLHNDPMNATKEVSALVSAGGHRLCDATTFENSGLTHGSIVTAVVTGVDELQEIEGMFHELMKKYCIHCELFSNIALELPSLRDIALQKGEGWSDYYEPSCMYGGFDTTVSKSENAKPGSQWELHCKYWNSLCEGYVEAYKITWKSGVVPVSEEWIW